MSVDGRVAIIPHVNDELRGWLGTHSEYYAAGALRDNHAGFRRIDLDAWSRDDVRALKYYVQLLATRKSLYRIDEYRQEDRHGRPLTPGELLQGKRTLLQTHGDRAIVLAKKGSKGDPSNPLFYTDETVVAAAVFFAIRRNTPTVILTRDEDLLEQFYKLQWLIYTHYRGLLLADDYLVNLRPTIAMPSDEPWSSRFEGQNNRLLKRSDMDLEQVLPRAYSSIRVDCWLMRPAAATMSAMTSNAESGMSRLLDVKGRTGGLNTERLLPRNCHIWLAPLDVPEELRTYAAIAEDVRSPMGVADVAIPALDLDHALLTSEQFKVGIRSSAAI